MPPSTHYGATLTLTFDLLNWKNLSYRLPYGWGTFTPIVGYLRLLVHELGRVRTTLQADRQDP